MRKSIEQAVGLIVGALLIVTVAGSVALMFQAEATNIKLINSLVRVGRANETIPLRVANSQLRIGLAQGLLTALLFLVTVYYAWQTRQLVRAAQPATDLELRMKEERLRAEEVALETQKALAQLRAIQQEMASLRPRPRGWWLR